MPEMTITPIGDATTIVGEAPLWSAAEQALFWIDGQQRRLMRWKDGATRVLDLPYRPSCLAPLADGRLVVGYKKGLGLFDPATGAATQIALPPAVDLGEVGFNDGICDAAGRFWIGTRHAHASAPVGALYRFGLDGAVTVVRGGVTVSNGLAFSPDGRRLYHADSRPGRIAVHRIDPITGETEPAVPFLDYAGLGCRPDGCTVDAEGFLWVAEIDGWRLARYAPNGRLDREVRLPVRKPSSVAFGGPDLGTLFVTTISYALSTEEMEAQPLAGRVLALRPGVKGLPEHSCRVAPWLHEPEAT